MVTDTSTRVSDAERKRLQRATERDLRISKVADPIRRRDCLADPYQFLPVYFGGIFTQEFTTTRREMVDGIRHAAQYGGDQAIAGPRGDGKTRSALFVGLELMLAQLIRFPLIISKSGPRASRELRNLKDAIRASPLLRADFPEVVEPFLALGGWSSRARQQTAFGEYTNLEWGVECVIFPTITSETLWLGGWTGGIESAARGQIFASLGIEGPIRGFCIRNERPDLAILDDIDDRESARSELQTDTRVHIIEEDVGGLAGPDKTIARVMLCTKINGKCVAATFTDRKQKPSWRGQTHKLLSAMPERMDLWEEYIGMRQGRGEDDSDARKAHELYLENREAMDAGAVVTNPFRYDARPLADGEPGQESALQACFDLIADRGWEHFNTEYQNDPPEEDGPIESGITAEKIQRRLSGYPRAMVPPGCNILTHGIDVQQRGLHWVVKAWRSDATNYVIDYGFSDSYASSYEKDQEGVELAIYRTVLSRMDELKGNPYRTTDDEPVPVRLTLVDSGWLTNAIYTACLKIGLGIYPAKGRGKSQGCVGPTFSPALKKTPTCKPGDGISWRLDKQEKGVWLANCAADHWKSFEHARWLTSEGKPGAAYLFGQVGDEERKYLDKRLPHDAKEHFAFARHLTAEIECEDIVRGVLRRIWKVKTGRVQNHYLDASYMADVAAAMLGIRLLKNPGARPLVRARRPAQPVEEVGAR